MQPLEGIRILDFFWLGAGPAGSLALSELGAEVVRIESQARLDKLREGGPFPGPSGVDLAGVFASLNYGKKSVTLNLGKPGAATIVYDLVKQCDVVTNNFKASTLTRFGLSFEELVAHNPRLVYITMSTMGAVGPCASYGAYGSHLSAMAGINAVTGSEEEIPIGMGPLVPDFSCNPFHAATAILAALASVRATGKAVNLDVSQLESTIHLLGPLVKEASLTGRQPVRVGSRHPWRVPHGVYRCAGDDEWIAISVGTDDEWDALVSLLGQHETSVPAWSTFLARQEQRQAVDTAVEQWTASRNKWEASRLLLEHRVPAWPVNNLRDQLYEDPVLRDEFVDVNLAGGFEATVQRIPVTFAGRREQPPGPPRLGEHSFEVLQSVLGYSDEKIADLVAAGVVD